MTLEEVFNTVYPIGILVPYGIWRNFPEEYQNRFRLYAEADRITGERIYERVS